MSEYKVNGEVTRDPAGYDSFDYSKKFKTRTTQLKHGKDREGFKTPQHKKDVLGVFKAIYEWKEHGKPLENVTRIKAQPNNVMDKENNTKKSKRDEGISH